MNEQVKRDNKKALPRYLMILLVSMIAGGVIGFLSATVGGSSLRESVLEGFTAGMTAVVPWGLPVSGVVLLVPGYLILRKAKKALAAWDGEDEDVSEAIEDQCNRALLLGNLALLLGFFFFSACLVYVMGQLRQVVFFALDLFLCVSLQRRLVDLIRIMNPEKQGSVYDMDFQKKWLDSCDELEQRQVGQAAWVAFRRTSIVCAVLWAVLLVLHVMFDTGLLPMAVALGIWGVLLVSYHLEAAKLGRRK